MMNEYLIYLIAYLAGSIPFGLVLTKLAGLGDIRQIGSGNIGATNVLRTGNKILALATLILDGAKGAIIVGILTYLSYPISHIAWAGCFTVIGHIFPIWLKGKGGKGVATTLATWLVINIQMGFLACLIWALIFFLSRISSLSALAATFLTCIYVFFQETALLYPITVMAGLIWFRHKDNIQRLCAGKEKSF